jgi:SAM-dependent methyltransferase
LDERPWYSGFFDHDYLRVFGPVLPEERTLALAEVARVLAPGGRFLLEVANREALVRGWHDSDVTRHDDGLVVLQERTLDLRTSRDWSATPCCTPTAAGPATTPRSGCTP